MTKQATVTESADLVSVTKQLVEVQSVGALSLSMPRAFLIMLESQLDTHN